MADDDFVLRFPTLSRRISRLLRFALAVVVVSVLAVVCIRNRELVTQSLEVLSRHWLLLSPCVVLSLAFVLAKSSSLQAAARAASLSPSLITCARAFVEGAAVEAATWPGKLWGDAHRTRLLAPAHDSSIRTALRPIVLWRGVSVASSTCILIAASACHLLASSHTISIRLAALGCACALGIVLTRRLLARAESPLQRRDFAHSMLASFAASVADLASIASIVLVLADVRPEQFLPTFVLLSLAASLSMLPMGVGVLDAGFWFVLTMKFGVADSTATACVLAYRVLGPCLTLVLGLASLACKAQPAEPVSPPLRDCVRPITTQGVPGGQSKRAA